MQQLFFMSYTYTRPYAPTGAMRIDDDDDDDTLIVLMLTKMRLPPLWKNPST